MTHIIDVSGELNFTEQTIEGQIETKEVTVGGSVSVPVGEYYHGEYAVTPSTVPQVIQIKGKTASDNITINPIPSNYGLITWNGSVLTVS